MMGSWIKSFVDGSTEHGSDDQIAAGQASWTRGRQDNIKEVQLTFGFFACSLSIDDTSWYQFDRYIVPVECGTHTPQRTHRVIQAEVKKHHVGKYLTWGSTCFCFFWFALSDKLAKQEDVCIEDKHVGQWITVTVPERGSPSFKFSNKGKI